MTSLLSHERIIPGSPASSTDVLPSFPFHSPRRFSRIRRVGTLPALGGIAMSAIIIPVDPDTARAFEQASAEEQRKLRLLLSLRLRELTTTPLPPLQTILDEVGREAQEKGLTPEMLDTLLHAE